MPDALTTFTNLINSPPGQLAAGGVLAGIVWKFFDRIDKLLRPATKRDIGKWMQGVRTEEGVKGWPETFTQMFDRLFGEKHRSWKCFGMSCLCSVVVFLMVLPYAASRWRDMFWPIQFASGIRNMILLGLPVMVAVDYLALLKTRRVLALMHPRRSTTTTEYKPRQPVLLAVLTFGDAIATGLMSGLAVFGSVGLAFMLGRAPLLPAIQRLVEGESGAVWDVPFSPLFRPFFYPAFFTSTWLWLYAGSGFLLIAARRFDIGFQWFNNHFDIEKHPLSSIGLVSGALVALIYWAAVIVSRVSSR